MKSQQNSPKETEPRAGRDRERERAYLLAAMQRSPTPATRFREGEVNDAEFALCFFFSQTKNIYIGPSPGPESAYE
jgi:hypothetical protein